MAAPKVCVFDAYGTLFDVAAAARACAEEPSEAPGRDAFRQKWIVLAEVWRRKQLEYSWLRAITGQHTDFWAVTGDALDYALESQGLEGGGELRERLMQLYFELEAFPEVPAMLQALKDQGRQLAILSNGEPKMLAAAASSAKLDGLLDSILSVESVGVYKPDASVYELVLTRFDCAPAEVVFVSSNGWDACSAAGFGFHSVWVNRRGEPVDRLPTPPSEIMSDLAALPARVAELSR